ncbi:MAG TPA: hypothetical protein VFK02_23785 [Kofleriaceae bacterium]|nr:hypothetical protein [Kofleriaceae bacterium]
MTDPIARIEAALSHLGSDHEPPAGWENRVIAATGAPATKRWWPYWVSALAIGTAGLTFLLIRDGKPAALELALAYDPPSHAVEIRGAANRGSSPELGDTLRAVAKGGQYRAVWVYRDERLISACPGAASCEYPSGETVAKVELNALGDYSVVALSGAVPLPPPAGSFDVDVSNATAAGAKVVTQKKTLY